MTTTTLLTTTGIATIVSYATSQALTAIMFRRRFGKRRV